MTILERREAVTHIEGTMRKLEQARDVAVALLLSEALIGSAEPVVSVYVGGTIVNSQRSIFSIRLTLRSGETGEWSSFPRYLNESNREEVWGRIASLFPEAVENGRSQLKEIVYSQDDVIKNVQYLYRLLVGNMTLNKTITLPIDSPE